jgi:hypothetical protein
VYPEDFVLLQDRIQLRQTDEILTQVRIATNPHLKAEEQREFVDTLMRQRRALLGVQEETLDRAALARLKDRLKKESKAVKVK